ncbi:expressed unknown protein [Seminavis robusta]|uniref:Uncharacterized protein n=1 Tax=Seminavis robusta TaxID=568900 RepID=A0A9N8DFE8_9STRA|nr:expressed unknown protein [Seminavis robusta]|eukprot:Sro118_g057650.1 n/a (361) ;mRNA; r:22700-23782
MLPEDSDDPEKVLNVMKSNGAFNKHVPAENVPGLERVIRAAIDPKFPHFNVAVLLHLCRRKRAVRTPPNNHVHVGLPSRQHVIALGNCKFSEDEIPEPRPTEVTQFLDNLKAAELEYFLANNGEAQYQARPSACEHAEHIADVLEGRRVPTHCEVSLLRDENTETGQANVGSPPPIASPSPRRTPGVKKQATPSVASAVTRKLPHKIPQYRYKCRHQSIGSTVAASGTRTPGSANRSRGSSVPASHTPRSQNRSGTKAPGGKGRNKHGLKSPTNGTGTGQASRHPSPNRSGSATFRGQSGNNKASTSPTAARMSGQTQSRKRGSSEVMYDSQRNRRRKRKRERSAARDSATIKAVHDDCP